MRIIFLGTPEFAVAPLQALHAAGHEIVLVVSQPDRPRGRGKKLQPTPIHQAADALGLPVFQPQRLRDAQAVQALADLQPELMITAAYGQILSQKLLNIAPRGVINLHASLLPAYRGAAPVQWAVIHGQTQTGVTTMQTARGVDTGDILLQQAVDILPQETAEQLLGRLSEIGAALLVKTVDGLAAGQITPIRQDPAAASHYPMLCKQDGFLDFTQPADALYNRIRGVTPWPGGWMTFAGQVYRVAEAMPLTAQQLAQAGWAPAAPGAVLAADDKQGLVIQCGCGGLRIVRIQAPNRAAMDARDYLRGNRLPADHADLPAAE